MSPATIFDIGLAVLVLGVAAWTILVRDTFAAVVSFGVTGMLLLGAAARLRPAEAGATPPSALICASAAGLCTLIAMGLAATTLILPDPAPTLAPAAMAGLPASGLGNPVTGVLFVYRALDTLLEKVVLVLALVGVWSLAADEEWGGTPEISATRQPDGILTFLAQLLPPVGIVLAIYMFWVGADHPGGAFQGGALLTAMWLLVLMAGVRTAPATGLVALRLVIVAGPVIFLAIGFAGFAWADGFLSYPAGYAKPLIVIAEAALTLSIGVTLGLLALGPPARIDRQ